MRGLFIFLISALLTSGQAQSQPGKPIDPLSPFFVFVFFFYFLFVIIYYFFAFFISSPVFFFFLSLFLCFLLLFSNYSIQLSRSFPYFNTFLLLIFAFIHHPQEQTSKINSKQKSKQNKTKRKERKRNKTKKKKRKTHACTKIQT